MYQAFFILSKETHSCFVSYYPQGQCSQNTEISAKVLDTILKNKSQANVTQHLTYQSSIYLFQMDSNYCCVLKAEKAIPISNCQRTLNQLIRYITESSNQFQLSSVELKQKTEGKILRLLSQGEMNIANLSLQAERPLEQKPSFIQQSISPAGQIHSQSQISIPIYEDFLKAFRCFIMFDYGRQFFFMFIRKGFDVDKSWAEERVKLQAKLLEVEKNPPAELIYQGSFGEFKCKYEPKAKCYFILLSRFHSETSRQEALLSELYNKVLEVPKYISFRYDILENQLRTKLEEIIDKHEEEYKQANPKNFMCIKKLEKALEKSYSQSNIFQSSISFKRMPSNNSTLFLKSALKLDAVKENEMNLQNDYEVGEIAERMAKYQCKPLQMKRQSLIQNQQNIKLND